MILYCNRFLIAVAAKCASSDYHWEFYIVYTIHSRFPKIENMKNFPTLFSVTISAALLLIVCIQFSYTCNEQVCASMVSKCMLTQSCKCDLKNCSCCKECYSCLSYLYTECCSCVGQLFDFQLIRKLRCKKNHILIDSNWYLQICVQNQTKHEMRSRKNHTLKIWKVFLVFSRRSPRIPMTRTISGPYFHSQSILMQ